VVRVNNGTAVPLVLDAEPAAGASDDAAQIAARLYAQHAASLHRYLLICRCQPADADELLQEAFLRLFRALRRGERIESPKAWLVRVLQNLRTDKARKESAYGSAEEGEMQQKIPVWASHAPSPEESVIHRERFDRLEKAMQALSERQHQYLLLRAEGLTFREIAEVHGVTIQSVAETCARAIERVGKLTNE
jgi:RNA polymerase sigma factor, sigma-70 family